MAKFIKTPTRRKSPDKPAKPDKPYPEFPLFAHAVGQWAKKIRGKLHYFGVWGDPNAALDKYMAQKDDLHAGRTPRALNDALTIRDLLHQFMTSKKLQMDAGELSPHSWSDYYHTCEWVKGVFGLTRLVTDLAADDFQRLKATLVKTCGPVSIGNDVQRVRVLFNWAYHQGLIDQPVRYGPAFKRPPQKVLRLERAKRGLKLFTPQQIRAMIRKAGSSLRAMILLGVNCGFGNSDCGNLPIQALDLAKGWVNYPRPKTGIMRRCPLWPETVEALRTVLADRKTPKQREHAGLVFITSRGDTWAKDTSDNPVTKETAKLLKELKLHRGQGKGFHVLRRVFETVAGESRDQVAVDAIMGRSKDDMASIYRQGISDERLLAVTDVVRNWLSWHRG